MKHNTKPHVDVFYSVYIRPIPACLSLFGRTCLVSGNPGLSSVKCFPLCSRAKELRLTGRLSLSAGCGLPRNVQCHFCKSPRIRLWLNMTQLPLIPVRFSCISGFWCDMCKIWRTPKSKRTTKSNHRIPSTWLESWRRQSPSGKMWKEHKTQTTMLIFQNYACPIPSVFLKGLGS